MREVTDLPDVERPKRLVVLAPNWLGDAVMALPVINDVHHAWPDTAIVVAARKSVPGTEPPKSFDRHAWTS